MAKEHQVALVSNVFTESAADGTRHITDVIFDKTGKVVSTYDKNHLFPTEATVFEPGPFKPTVVEMFGHTFGLIICYEGFWPVSHPGDY